MTTQAGVDLLDLYFNGDTATLSGDADYNFLKIDDGWIKQISQSGHVIDKTSESGLTLDGFMKLLRQFQTSITTANSVGLCLHIEHKNGKDIY